jgi:hypothetical protein
MRTRDANDKGMLSQRCRLDLRVGLRGVDVALSIWRCGSGVQDFQCAYVGPFASAPKEFSNEFLYEVGPIVRDWLGEGAGGKAYMCMVRVRAVADLDQLLENETQAVLYSKSVSSVYVCLTRSRFSSPTSRIR